MTKVLDSIPNLKNYQFIFYEDIFQKKKTKYKDDGFYIGAF
jgi:hypothetical protein